MKRVQITLIPLISSITFLLFFWITMVRTPGDVMGLRQDVAGGLVMGVGLGLVLSLMFSIRRKPRRSAGRGFNLDIKRHQTK
ncbi:hypothetical protein HHX48_18275 [Salinimonas sp. HHU 13199]|uniref:Uncharacterized protein n=1 Tax=Salinimonas profundi TaxID=2729140 RepID=A0ABR8LNC6_9ALTE|nr:hypothetical protein [Salinimonas profundi]MBD3587688.1 hypothetical protein [Salinimonas profundi]